MPPDSASLSRLPAAAADQANRLLDLSTPLGPNKLVAETLAGVESLSDGGFRLT